MPRIVKTEYGKISGIRKDDCICYLGIPYALPPIGKRTYKHPQKPRPWPGVYPAEAARGNAIQYAGDYSTDNITKDCLYLNVYVPLPLSKSLRPVLVWIHGGGFNTGGTGAMESGEISFDMCHFAIETQCIVVTLNYRLNLYGFANLTFLGKDFDLNNGLYDQMLALHFVKDNIKAFGGDPDNITLFGQSAGGSSVLALLAMEESRNLVNKAAVFSANADHFFKPKESRKSARKLLNYLGIEKKEDLFRLRPDQIMEAIRELEKYFLLKGDIRVPFGPTIDGKILPDLPKRVVARLDLPLLIGTTKDEGLVFIKDVPDPLLIAARRYMKVKAVDVEGSRRQRTAKAVTQHVFDGPVDEILENYQGPAWRYHYNYVSPKAREMKLDAFHTAELPLLFDQQTPWLGFDLDDQTSLKVGEEMRDILAHFAWYDHPGFEPYALHHRSFPIEADEAVK